MSSQPSSFPIDDDESQKGCAHVKPKVTSNTQGASPDLPTKPEGKQKHRNKKNSKFPTKSQLPPSPEMAENQTPSGRGRGRGKGRWMNRGKRTPQAKVFERKGSLSSVCSGSTLSLASCLFDEPSEVSINPGHTAVIVEFGESIPFDCVLSGEYLEALFPNNSTAFAMVDAEAEEESCENVLSVHLSFQTAKLAAEFLKCQTTEYYLVQAWQCPEGEFAAKKDRSLLKVYKVKAQFLIQEHKLKIETLSERLA
jgi:hypothetical protein